MKEDVRKQRRNRCPLRRPRLRARPFPVLDDACPEPLLDQPQDPFVRDPMLEELHKPRLVEAGEEVADVSVEHEVHLPARDPDSKRVQRIMLRAPRPEPVRETEEVLLVYGVQHLDHRPLKDLILKRSDPERPQPPPGSRRESHPPAPTDPQVSLSTHTARAVQLLGRCAVPPVHEQLGFPYSDPAQPRPRSAPTALQSLVLPPRPPHQMEVDAMAERGDRVRVE